MRKWFSIIAIGLVMLVVSSACGPVNTNTSPVSTPQAITPTVPISPPNSTAPAQVTQSTPKSSSSPSSQATAPSSIPPSAQTLPPEIEKGLLILSHSTYVDAQGYFHIVGEVQNIGKNNSGNNSVTVTFYDEQGVPGLTGSGKCYLEIVESGVRSPFEIVFSTTPKLKNYRLTAEWQFTGLQPNKATLLREIEAKTDADGYYIVTGKITNSSENVIDVAMVIGTFYDSQGTVVAVGVTFGDVAPLEPHMTSAFTIAVEPHVSSNVSSYSLQVQGYE